MTIASRILVASSLILIPAVAAAQSQYGTLRAGIERLSKQMEEVSRTPHGARQLRRITGVLGDLTWNLKQRLKIERPSASMERELGGVLKGLLDATKKVHPPDGGYVVLFRRWQILRPRTVRNFGALRGLVDVHNELADLTTQHFLTPVEPIEFEVPDQRSSGFAGLSNQQVKDAFRGVGDTGTLLTRYRRWQLAPSGPSRPAGPHLTLKQVLDLKVDSDESDGVMRTARNIEGLGLPPRAAERILNESVERRPDGTYAVLRIGNLSPLGQVINYVYDQTRRFGSGSSPEGAAKLLRQELPRILRDLPQDDRELLRGWIENKVSSLER